MVLRTSVVRSIAARCKGGEKKEEDAEIEFRHLFLKSHIYPYSIIPNPVVCFHHLFLFSSTHDFSDGYTKTMCQGDITTKSKWLFKTRIPIHSLNQVSTTIPIRLCPHLLSSMFKSVWFIRRMHMHFRGNDLPFPSRQYVRGIPSRIRFSITQTKKGRDDRRHRLSERGG